MTPPTLDPSTRGSLHDYCRQHFVRRLALFGSRSTGADRPDSDVDLLVEFAEGKEPGLIGMAVMEEELSRLFGGKKVELRTPRELSRHFRDDVMRNALVQYVA